MISYSRAMKLVLVLVLATAGCAKKQQAAKPAAPAPVEQKADEKPAAPESAPAAAGPAAPDNPCQGGEATKH